MDELCCLPLCDPPPLPSLSVSHCSVAPINPKTHLGSPWFNQSPRRRKPQHLPLPPLDWQPLQTQALCPLSKGRAPDPARPLSPPTHLRMMMMMKIMREMEKKAVREVHFHLQWRLVTHGTASLRQQTQQVQTRPLIKEAHPALSAPQAARARNGRHLALLGHLLVTKFSLIPSPPLAPPLQLLAQRVCPQAQTTVPLSSLWLAVPAATRNTTSPKASQSLPFVHRMTPSLPLLPPRLSISVSLPRAPPLLQCQHMPAQLQPLHKPLATQGPEVLDLHHHDPPPLPVHWRQRPPNHTTSGHVRRTPSTEKLLPVPLILKPGRRKVPVPLDPLLPATGSRLLNARCSQINTSQ